MPSLRLTPQLIPFAGKHVIILGADFRPRLWDGTATAPPEITNTFTAAYPAWQATTSYITGDFVKPTGAPTQYFKCVQGGTSGTVEPSWPSTKGQRVTDGKVIWENAGAISTSPAPPGAAHGIIHANALFLYNTSPTNTADGLDGPSALRMSDIGNPNSWNPLNAAFIDKDDGMQGTGIATFTISEAGVSSEGGLVLFKEFATHLMTGLFGSANLEIRRIQTDMGCIAPRSTQFVPGFGVARLSHLGIAIYDGTRDRLISEDIRPYLFGGRADIAQLDWSYAHLSRSSQTAVPPMYIIAIPTIGSAGKLNRILAYDLVLKAWTAIDPPFNLSHIHQIRTQGTQPITALCGYSSGSVESWQMGETRGWQTWATNTGVVTNGTQVSWSLRTPDVYSQPATRTYFRQVWVRGVDVNGGTLTIQVVLHNESGESVALPPQTVALGTSSGQFVAKADINRTGLNCYAIVSGTGIMEIEAVVFDVLQKAAVRPALRP